MYKTLKKCDEVVVVTFISMDDVGIDIVELVIEVLQGNLHNWMLNDEMEVVVVY